jgi:hypothetical protein
VKLSGGRIRASSGLKKYLKRHRTKRLALRLNVVDVQGRHNAVRVRFTGRR